MQAGRPFSRNSLWVIPQRTQVLESKSKRCPRAVRSSGILALDSDVILIHRTPTSDGSSVAPEVSWPSGSSRLAPIILPLIAGLVRSRNGTKRQLLGSHLQ